MKFLQIFCTVVIASYVFKPSESTIIVRGKDLATSGLAIKDQQVGVLDSSDFTQTKMHYYHRLCPCEYVVPIIRNEDNEHEFIGHVLLTELSKVCSAEVQVGKILEAGYDYVIFFDPMMDDSSLPFGRKKLKLISPVLLQAALKGSGSKILSISFVTLNDAKKLQQVALKSNKFDLEIWENDEKNRRKPFKPDNAYRELKPSYESTEYRLTLGHICIGLVLGIIIMKLISLIRMSRTTEAPMVQQPVSDSREASMDDLMNRLNMEAFLREYISFQETQRLEMKEMALSLIPDLLCNQKVLDEDAIQSCDTCIICLENFTVGSTVPSIAHGCLKNNNFLHADCIEKWFTETANKTGKLRCPICRLELNDGDELLI